MTDFKQIIGRGTRVREDYGKLWFNIIDHTGSATRNFADPNFAGEPVLATQELDKYGVTRAREIMAQEPPPTPEEEEPRLAPAVVIEPPDHGQPRKHHYDNGNVRIIADIVQDLDPDGPRSPCHHAHRLCGRKGARPMQ
jgi:type I restriction enzyme R subunit